MAPKLYTQYAALRGDPSDNLPGVPGVGEKTAAKLINTYGGIDGIFEHVDEQTPKLRASLAEHEATVRSNADVMVLLRDVPLEIAPDGLRLEPFDREEVRKLFDFLEFRTLHERLAEAFGEGAGDAAPAVAVLEAEVETIDDPEDARSFLDRLRVEHRRNPWPSKRHGTDRKDAVRCSASRSSATRATRDTVWIPRRALDDAAVASVAAGAHRRGRTTDRRARREAADARAARPARSRPAHALPRHDARRVPARPRRVALPAGGSAAALRRPRAAGRRRHDANRASCNSISTASRRTVRSKRRGARSPSRRSSNRSPPRSTRNACARCTTTSRCRSCACWRRWKTPASRSTPTELKHLNDTLSAECEELTREIWNDAGEEFNVNSTLEAPRDPVRPPRAAADEEDEDRLLHRRGVTREAGGTASDHRAPAALPRGREAALDVRRRTAERGAPTTAASTPRSTRPSRAPGA